MLLLFENAKACINAPQILAMDEGRSKSTSVTSRNVTYTPQKPCRVAVDVHYVACSLQFHSGYFLGAKPHCKDYMEDEEIKLNDDEGHMDNIMHQLILEVDAPRNVYVTDLKYTSVYSAETLTPEYSSGQIGNIQSTRNHLPKGYNRETGEYGLFSTARWKNRVKNMDKGDFVQFFCGDVNLCVWKDKSTLYLIDNCVDPDLYVDIQVTHNKRRRTITVPAVVKAYRQYLRLVDCGNEHRASFGIEQKSLRKHNNTFMGILESVVFCNGALIWADVWQQRSTNQKELRVEWINQVCQKAFAQNPDKLKLKPRRLSMASLRRSTLCSAEEHRLIPFRSDRNRQIECKYCRWYRSTRKLTTWMCSACKVNDAPIGFCKKRRCFQLWPMHEESHVYG